MWLSLPAVSCVPTGSAPSKAIPVGDMLADTGFGLDSFIWRTRRREDWGELEGQRPRPYLGMAPWSFTEYVIHTSASVTPGNNPVRLGLSPHFMDGKVRLPKLSRGLDSSSALFKSL